MSPCGDNKGLHTARPQNGNIHAVRLILPGAASTAFTEPRTLLSLSRARITVNELRQQPAHVLLMPRTYRSSPRGLDCSCSRESRCSRCCTPWAGCSRRITEVFCAQEVVVSMGTVCSSPARNTRGLSVCTGRGLTPVLEGIHQPCEWGQGNPTDAESNPCGHVPGNMRPLPTLTPAAVF